LGTRGSLRVLRILGAQPLFELILRFFVAYRRPAAIDLGCSDFGFDLLWRRLLSRTSDLFRSRND